MILIQRIMNSVHLMMRITVMIVHQAAMIQKAQAEPMVVVMALTMMLMVSVMMVTQMMIMIMP